MNAALFVQDKELKGNDFLFFNESVLLQDNPIKKKVFSKLAFPHGLHIYKSDFLDIYTGLKSINISTCLADDYVDIQSRKIPIMFYSSGLKSNNAIQTFIHYVDVYGGKVDTEVLYEIKRTLEKYNKRKRIIEISCVFIVIVILLLILLYWIWKT